MTVADLFPYIYGAGCGYAFCLFRLAERLAPRSPAVPPTGARDTEPACRCNRIEHELGRGLRANIESVLFGRMCTGEGFVAETVSKVTLPGRIPVKLTVSSEL